MQLLVSKLRADSPLRTESQKPRTMNPGLLLF